MSYTAASLTHYAWERRRLIESAPAGSHSAAELARLTDEAVAALTAAASLQLSGPVAVLALGGYGSQRLLPASDIDLLVVPDGSVERMEAFTRDLFYPFWDLGLKVGHQVRTRREHMRACRDDLTILTATLTGRFVAGDRELAQRVLHDVAVWARRKRKRLEQLIGDRDRPGSPYLLEPDLKEGIGGQRDIDELTWLAALHAGAPAHSPARLVDAGLVDEAGSDRLLQAQEVLCAARWQLGVLDSRTPNIMSIEAASDAGLDASAVQAALADVDTIRAQVREEAPCTRDGVWDAERLAAALRAGSTDLPALERAAWSGHLDSLVPGLRSRMVLRRPALGHRYTVGAHTLRAAWQVTDPDPSDEMAAQILDDLPTDTPLIVAALAHDAGKDTPGPGHAGRGERVAIDVARAFGLARPLEWGVALLVREHLLLSEIAATQDLTDEDVILRAAARLGDRSLVGPLYLLTQADMRATGPDVWTSWRATLIRELASKIDAALTDEVDGAGIVAQARAVRDAALSRATAAGMERSVMSFLEEAPLRYLSGREVDDVLRHARLVRELRGPVGRQNLVVDVTPASADSTWKLTVVTRDRPGLFAAIAGVISLADLDILGAEAFTESSGVVIDTFAVCPASGAAVGPERWSRVERLLRAALDGHVDLEARLAERRRHYRTGVADIPSVAYEVGSIRTTVKVTAPDRVGLLHDLAETIHSAGLDITFAVAESSDGSAVDTFHVVDAQGTAPRDLMVLESLASSLLAVATRP